ncbi:MAG: hypothetical protein HQL03_10145 [Nitrospirae bacterium]|nr:hypothetical protein [Nitrospirota bacterium]
MIEAINNKEELILSHPTAHPLLRHKLKGIRRYKSGRIRIFYALSTEQPYIWESKPEKPPEEPEIMFLYVDLRNDDTYKDFEDFYDYLKKQAPLQASLHHRLRKG